MIRPIALLLFALPAAGQIPGRNVNMVSGTSWPSGDPFLQRQNEPSLAVSSRNPAHILSGSNDYRTVDLPGLPDNETGDAWLGVFKSYDGGQTWRSTVHPGCPQTIAACDGAPLLKNYAAAADPVVRASTNGLFYFSGIAFSRNSPKKSTVFVSRFIDNNNEENGDPIKYVSTTAVATGSDATFLDKPWIAVDIPRAGAGTCSITVPQANGNPLTQKFAAGNAYIAYTAFTDESKPPSQIFFARTTDCGATWSKPTILADGALNQGASLAVDPNTGAVYVGWRRFKSPGITDAIMFAQSANGGLSFSAPVEVAAINPFDQGTTGFSFRTNAYPTMTVDGASRVYLAWTERNQGAAPSGGDARIVLSTSRDGRQWTSRYPINDYSGRGHQFMPAMTFAGGKVMVLFYDLRLDATIGNYKWLGGSQYVETRIPAGDLATTPPHPEKVFTNFLLDAAPANLNLGGLLRRHTLDVYSAQAEPADTPPFVPARISQYIFGSRPGSKLIEQLQVNPPNFPLFKQGSAPFMGDYLDIAASPSFISGAEPGTWKFNTEPSRSVIFHAIWTDNRDVRPPANGDWTDYTPPTSPISSGFSIFDPTQPQPACRTGQAGMRNQNIYTARITQGLVITSPSNAKALGSLERAFPVSVANSTTRSRTYRLSIPAQPRGGKASFLQVRVAGLPDPLTVLDVNVAPGSSISRMVFVRSTDRAAIVRVNVDEISAPGAIGPLADGLQGSLVLNPDPLNPENTDLSKSELFNPDIANPDIANPDIANPDIANPDIANPDIANPDIANPDIANPDIANPDIANPDIANPDIANPDIANPDIANGAISDATWKLTNKGNATATYTIQFLLTGVTIPPGVKTQLIIHRSYRTPVANGCALVEEPHIVVIANISNPTLLTQQTAARLRNLILARAGARNGRLTLNDADTSIEITDESLTNATVTVGPNETIYLTLRFFNPDRNTPLQFDIGKAITTVSISHAINTGANQTSIAASHLIVATSSLQAAVAGRSYSQSLIAAGGSGPLTWTLTKGSLPPGLTLSPSGEISGTATGDAINYAFTVQVTDSANPANIQVQDLSIQVTRVALALLNVNAAGPSGTIVKPGDTVTVTATIGNSGTPADSVILGLSLIPGGTASADCTGPAPASLALNTGAQQVVTFTCRGVTGNGTLAFQVGVTGLDRSNGADITISPLTSNPVTVNGPVPQLTVTLTANGAPYAPGSWTNQSVSMSVDCVSSSGASIQDVSPERTLYDEGVNQFISASCTDRAGNSSQTSVGPINIDRTPPRITLVNRPAPNANGWYTTDSTFTWACADQLSGVRADSISRTISGDGANQGVSGTCTDEAGNTATDSVTVNVDRTPPVLTGQTSQALPPNGWFKSAVDVTFSCTDATSGVAAGDPQGNSTVSGDTAGVMVNGTCHDLAGNLATASVGPVRIDNTPPVLQLVSIVPQTGAGWSNGPVTITWNCVDAVSGPVTPTVTRTLTASGSATATCSDNAGNSTSDTQSNIRIDTTAPFVTVNSPINNFVYPVNSPVIANFSCADGGGSGMASCTAPVASGHTLDLSTPGTYSFTVTGTDNAGNQTSVTRSYRVQ